MPACGSEGPENHIEEIDIDDCIEYNAYIASSTSTDISITLNLLLKIKMATLTIRNLDEEVKRQLRIQGAKNDRSMEAEARAILEKSLLTTETNIGLASRIREIVTPYGGVNLDLPDRKKDASDKRLTVFPDE